MRFCPLRLFKMKYKKAMRINEAIFPTLSKIVRVHNKENIPINDKPTIFYGKHFVEKWRKSK